MIRSKWQSMLQGFHRCCPACGKGALFKNYLGVNHSCNSCGTELHHQRADDAPPYFTMTIVAHLVIPGLLVAEKMFKPDLWVHFATWIPLTILLTWWFMPRIKGAIIGLQWALKMHGFGDKPDEPAQT